MIYAFTSCALNYAPKARILVESMRKHAPQVRFCLALADKAREHDQELLKYFDEVISIEDIDEINNPSWIFKHEIVELATAIKPFVLREILKKDDCDAVFYFDPDMALFSDIEEMTEELFKNNILLTPHLTDPETTIRGIEDNELSALKHGVYNLGYVGVRNSSEGKRFADWWASRLKNYCRDDIPAGIFTDQRWIDLAPAFFEGVKPTRHPGYNVAPWNMTNRHIEKDIGHNYTVNKKPLVFYHFTGFDSGAHRDMLSIYSSNSPAAAEIFSWYVEQLEERSGDPLSKTPWAYGVFEDGSPISKQQRLLYRDREDLKKAFPNPYSILNNNNKPSFSTWWNTTGILEINPKISPTKNMPTTYEKSPPIANTENKKSFIQKLTLILTNNTYRKNTTAIIRKTYLLWGIKGVILFLVTGTPNQKFKPKNPLSRISNILIKLTMSSEFRQKGLKSITTNYRLWGIKGVISLLIKKIKGQ